jgi:ATP-dependent Lhr-like helicase
VDGGFLPLKRTFRNCAVISGLIERRHPGKEKTGPAGHRFDRPRL